MKNLIIAIFAIATLTLFTSCEGSNDPGYDGPYYGNNGGAGGGVIVTVGGGGNGGGGSQGDPTTPIQMYVWDIVTDKNFWALDSDGDLVGDDASGFSEGIQMLTKINNHINDHLNSGAPGVPGAMVSVIPGVYNPLTGLYQNKIVAYSFTVHQ